MRPETVPIAVMEKLEDISIPNIQMLEIERPATGSGMMRASFRSQSKRGRILRQIETVSLKNSVQEKGDMDCCEDNNVRNNNDEPNTSEPRRKTLISKSGRNSFRNQGRPSSQHISFVKKPDGLDALKASWKARNEKEKICDDKFAFSERQEDDCSSAQDTIRRSSMVPKGVATHASVFDVADATLKGYASSIACTAKTQEVFNRYAKPEGGTNKKCLNEVGFVNAFDALQGEWDKFAQNSMDLIAMRRLFHLFRSKQGVSLESFARCIRVIVYGSEDQKFRLSFDIYDFDQSGSFGIDGINRIMSSLDESDTENMWDGSLFSEQVLLCFDVNAGSFVDFQTYRKACVMNPVLLDCCSHGMMGGKPKTMGKLQGMSNRSEKFRFNWRTMKMLWTQMRQKGDQGFHQYECVDLKGFQAVMSGFFNPHSQLDKRLVERLFVVFDVDGNHNICLKEFMQGLSRIFHGSEETRARFYFHLFDLVSNFACFITLQSVQYKFDYDIPPPSYQEWRWYNNAE